MSFDAWCRVRLMIIRENLEAQQWDWQRRLLTYERRDRFRTLYLEVSKQRPEDLEWA